MSEVGDWVIIPNRKSSKNATEIIMVLHVWLAYIGGYPQHVRTDCGTENNVMAAIECLVTNDASAHIYGTSPGKQRIKAWWSFFQRYRSQWWIKVFEKLVEFGAFHPECDKEVECL